MGQPIYIFLDLNKWIDLSRDYHGRLQHEGHRGIASALLEKVDNDEVRMPVGIVHFLEHLQNESPARRKRLAEVFEVYSRGWCFAAWSDICNVEVRQGLKQVLDGLSPARPDVFGRGSMFTASAKGREIVSKGHTREFSALLSDACAQPGALFDLLTTTIDANRKQQKISTANLSSKNAIASEDLRMRRRDCSREEYRRAQYATYTLTLEKVLVEQLALMHRSIREFLELGEESLSQFWTDIPSINTGCELTAYRDRQWSRHIQPNDVRDLAQLAIGVPYCDAVVIEKFWKRAITETELGQKYGTAVFCDIAELLPYLASDQQSKW
jgi:hypothetical protein